MTNEQEQLRQMHDMIQSCIDKTENFIEKMKDNFEREEREWCEFRRKLEERVHCVPRRSEYADLYFVDQFPMPGEPYSYMPHTSANPGVTDRSHLWW